jgi:hypothetical protein
MQFGAKRCAQWARRGAHGPMGGPNRPEQRAQDLQGHLRSPIHGKRDWSGVPMGYLLVSIKKAKEELWNLKCFTIQKYHLSKILI